jgi:hypothetical protein
MAASDFSVSMGMSNQLRHTGCFIEKRGLRGRWVSDPTADSSAQYFVCRFGDFLRVNSHRAALRLLFILFQKAPYGLLTNRANGDYEKEARVFRKHMILE